MVKLKEKEDKNRLVFAHNLNTLMYQHNKTRNDMCIDLGFSYMTLSDWLRGKTFPRIERLEQLANYFQVTVSDLIDDHQPQGVKIPEGITIIDAHTNMPYEFNQICGALNDSSREKLFEYAMMLKRLQDLENGGES